MSIATYCAYLIKFTVIAAIQFGESGIRVFCDRKTSFVPESGILAGWLVVISEIEVRVPSIAFP